MHAAASPHPPVMTSGLRFWMEDVLAQCDHVAHDFAIDPVHDLRVALRRCRSLADGLIALDPSPEWKKMKKAGRKLFQSLGQLRDVQVMMEWVDRLSPATPATRTGDILGGTLFVPAPQRDPVALALLEAFRRHEQEHKLTARAALDAFDRKQWRQWSRSLPARASHFRPGSPLFQHLALERWTQARKLHRRALRNRSQAAYHELRIGVKRFRYIVENFLPPQHEAWGRELKKIQDVLGEVHDLDVLWAAAEQIHVFPDLAARQAWRGLIAEARDKRLDLYHEQMVGPDSLWTRWRTGLPQGPAIREIATRRLKIWARALDPDFAHSEHVAKLALGLFDGLLANGLLKAPENATGPRRAVSNSASDSASYQGMPSGIPKAQRAEPAFRRWNSASRVSLSTARNVNDQAGLRSNLQLAALLHDVGKSQGQKSHHKKSADMVLAQGAPLGWDPAEIRRVALIARFHAGALPTKRHQALRDLLPPEQTVVIELAAVLRLANALDVSHDAHIRQLQVKIEGAGSKQVGTSPVVIAAEGYSPHSQTAQTAAAERHLLETVLQRPVVIRAMKKAASEQPGSLLKNSRFVSGHRFSVAANAPKTGLASAAEIRPLAKKRVQQTAKAASRQIR